MKIRTMEDADLKGKKVLLRVDFNVPLKNGKVADDTRIIQTLPTLKYLLKQKAKVIVVTHVGRPDGKAKDELRVTPVSKYLSKLLKKTVKSLPDCLGKEVEKAVSSMKPGDIIFLENVRFYPQEEKNDLSFAKKLAALAEVYVSDSFATAHRAHASTVGVTKYLPAYAGFLMQKEVEHLSDLVKNTVHPFTVMVGGAKIDTKIGLLENFLSKADYFLIGGGLANTFLAAEGYNVGASLYEKDKIETAQSIMLQAESLKDNFVLPEDVIVADEIGEKVTTMNVPVDDVMGDMRILDIGKKSAKKFADIIGKSKMVLWNGPLGLYEYKPFRGGTQAVASALKKAKKSFSVLGGGDTIDAIKKMGFQEKDFDFVSTGGGAMLEFLEGNMLPGVEVLLNQKNSRRKK